MSSLHFAHVIVGCNLTLYFRTLIKTSNLSQDKMLRSIKHSGHPTSYQPQVYDTVTRLLYAWYLMAAVTTSLVTIGRMQSYSDITDYIPCVVHYIP